MARSLQKNRFLTKEVKKEKKKSISSIRKRQVLKLIEDNLLDDIGT